MTNVLHLPTTPERFVTRQELADIMRVSTRQIDRWVKDPDPMPSYTWGIRTRRFRVSEALAWAKRRETGKAA
jgi:phage terminase Nu1 subunit (DNA packaging protein)